jgi:hypothetical protein
MNADITNIINDRLVRLIKTPNSLGNIVFIENPDEESSIINLLWDVGFTTSIEAILFQRTFITILANLYYEFSGISCQITDDSIFLNVEDHSGAIIKPTTQITQSKIYTFSNHYKGQISLNLKFINNISELLNSVEAQFKNLLTEIKTAELSI